MRKRFGMSHRSVAAPALLIASLLIQGMFLFGFTKYEAAKGGITHPKKLITFVIALQKAVREGNKSAVTNIMQYPLRLPLENGTEVDVDTAKEFLGHYDKIMTKAMQRNLLALNPDDILFRRSGALLACDDARQLWVIERDDKMVAYIKGI